MTLEVRGLVATAALLSVLGCDRAAPDLREWQPSDHDNTPTDTQAAPANNGRQSTGRDMGVAGIDEVVFVAWKQNCIVCHGTIGRGDGPQGRALRATDLTRPDWHASVTDEQIAVTITQGRGAMPGFQLPKTTVDGLVRLIRMLNPQGRAGAAVDGGTAVDGAAAPHGDGAGVSPAKPAVDAGPAPGVAAREAPP